MKHFLLAASALSLLACGNHDSDHGHSHVSATGEHMQSGIEVSSAYVMPPFPGRDTAAGFFVLTNHGNDDRLLSASSPISQSVEIHTHTNEDGVMKMRKVEGVDIAHGETITFKPGSYHLMMYGATIPENAEDVALTLTYENAEPVTLIVPLGDPENAADNQHGSGH